MEHVSLEELNAQVKTMLETAGYSPSRPQKQHYNISRNSQKIATVLASMWKKKLGVDEKIQNQDWNTYIDSQSTDN